MRAFANDFLQSTCGFPPGRHENRLCRRGLLIAGWAAKNHLAIVLCLRSDTCTAEISFPFATFFSAIPTSMVEPSE